VEKAEGITIDNNGATILRYMSRDRSSHIMIAVSVQIVGKDRPAERSYHMHFYVSEKSWGPWSEERKPVATTVRLNRDGKYYLCK